MNLVRILSEAAEDIEQARAFYKHIESGIGDYFTGSIIADLERLVLFHGIHPRHFGYYRALTDHFPFGIYYREADNQTEVLAIPDLRRDPAWIRAEIFKRK